MVEYRLEDDIINESTDYQSITKNKLQYNFYFIVYINSHKHKTKARTETNKQNKTKTKQNFKKSKYFTDTSQRKDDYSTFEFRWTE